jgi:hypothetical protein
VKDGKGRTIAPYDTAAVQQYLSYFMALYVEAWASNSKDPEIDSVRRTNHFLEIDITDVQNRREHFKFYHKKPLPKNDVLDGVKVPYDPENMYVKFGNDKEFARVLVYSWGKLFQPASYFYPRGVKKW